MVEVPTSVVPTGNDNYLAIGFFNAEKTSWLSSMPISDTGALGTTRKFYEAAITGYDIIPLPDGSVAVAATSFGAVSNSLTGTKLVADGSVVWQSAPLQIDASTTGVSIEELRGGRLAVVVSSIDPTDNYNTEVFNFDAAGNLIGVLITADEYRALLTATEVVASGVSSIDGSLFIATTTNPEAGADAFAVTKFVGDESGRFVDDDGNTHETNIERLAAAGITGGCDPANLARYCPNDDVTRAQMATFLATAAEIPPAAPGTDAFTDDDGNIHEANINALAAAGVTLGCDPTDLTRYCPGDDVTRGQMATFLVRAFDLDDVSTPTNTDPFADDDGSVHEANIAILFDAGITLGCDASKPPLFCPADPVSRAQMASFIIRTIDSIGP